jgi:hypothetical protein|tara:strand:- start:1186 stop:1482 length:297 start_codon:yes stop_codon:yes gene_type:complete
MMNKKQKADRLALIATTAERLANSAKFKKKLKAKSKVFKTSPVYVELKAQKADAINDFNKSIDKMDENYNQWTDASKYADTYYGDTMRETTKFDNDWG